MRRSAIYASLIALALLATGCERQPRDKLQSPAKGVRSKIIDSWTTHEALIVEFSTALYKPGCAVCLHSHSEWMCEDVCRDLVIIRSIEDDMRLHTPDTNKPNFTVSSINGKPVTTKKVEDMAVGEEGWTASINYHAGLNEINPGSNVLSRRTDVIDMHIKRTAKGFEVMEMEEGDDESKDGAKCLDEIEKLEKRLDDMMKEKAI